MHPEQRSSRSRRPRIALYSHDAQGLGHIRRNLAIAGALSELRPAPDILLVTGAPEAAGMRRPAGADLVVLPSLSKDAAGTYGPRHLAVPMTELTALRAAVIRAALRSFAPDLLIVDKHPRGFRRELEPALDTLTAAGTRVVLGLRDVLDEPACARAEWEADRSNEAIARWYTRIWLYGDRQVHDPTTSLGLDEDARRKVVATGYLAQRRPVGPEPTSSCTARSQAERPYVLCLVGGGSDGALLAEAFVRAPMPDGHSGVLALGPQMPEADRDRIRRIAARNGRVRVCDFLPAVESWLDGASAVASMGGYNTVCETVARGKPFLVVPRVRPRTEQLIRANDLAAKGLLDTLHPDELKPSRLGAWLTAAVRRPTRIHPGVDLDGLDRLPRLATALVEDAVDGRAAKDAQGTQGAQHVA